MLAKFELESKDQAPSVAETEQQNRPRTLRAAAKATNLLDLKKQGLSCLSELETQWLQAATQEKSPMINQDVLGIAKKIRCLQAQLSKLRL